MTAERERDVRQAYDTLTGHMLLGPDVDAVELLGALCTAVAKLLDFTSVGLLLANENGVLHVLAATSEATRTLELYQLQRDQGPCLDCYSTHVAVSVPDLSAAAERWPAFVDAAVKAGFRSVHALPMTLNSSNLGAMGLFGERAGELSDDDRSLAMSLLQVASIALVASRAAHDQEEISNQLQQALSSRIVLEQAKGLLAAVGNLNMEESFRVLRNYARGHNTGLKPVATSLVQRELKARDVIAYVRSRNRKRSS